MIVLVVACTDTGGEDQDTVKIALEAPITGEQASNGVDMLNGAQLAADEANEADGIMGMQIDVVPADDEADPETGKVVAQRMVDEGVFAVIGPYNSSVGVENLQTYLDAGIVTIHLTSNEATNGQGFTVQPKDFQTAPIEADAITEHFGARTVAMIHDPQTYTAGIASQLRDLLEERRIEIVLFEASEPDRDSYVALLRRVKALSPDLLYVQTYYPQGGRSRRTSSVLASRRPASWGWRTRIRHSPRSPAQRLLGSVGSAAFPAHRSSPPRGTTSRTTRRPSIPSRGPGEHSPTTR